MRRTPSPLVRALRTAIALVTIWCLGCSAYDPLLDSLFGSSAGSGMACASDAGARGTDAPAAKAGTGDSVPSVSAMATDGGHSGGGFACGCQSCHAASPAATAVAPAPLELPSAPAAEAATLVSAEREPLVPPPQVEL